MTRRQVWVVGSNLALAIFWLRFVYVNYQAYASTGNLIYALGTVENSIIALMFLVRSPAVASSTSPLDYAIPFGATFLPQLLRPELHQVPLYAVILVGIGTSVSLAGIVFLNRSFGIVPTVRNIRTGGIYRAIRHPMYAGGLIVVVGFTLGNFSIANLAVAILTATLVLMRMHREELFL
jgi:protein-S-isoprenylcysteine O-methyltransferase Ste14